MPVAPSLESAYAEMQRIAPKHLRRHLNNGSISESDFDDMVSFAFLEFHRKDGLAKFDPTVAQWEFYVLTCFHHAVMTYLKTRSRQRRVPEGGSFSLSLLYADSSFLQDPESDFVSELILSDVLEQLATEARRCKIRWPIRSFTLDGCRWTSDVVSLVNLRLCGYSWQEIGTAADMWPSLLRGYVVKLARACDLGVLLTT